MQAELISIGDEILIGQINNTNSVWIAQQLNLNGISVAYMCTVSDNRQAILDALHAAEKRATLVIITGGLGPTRDDLTKQVLADYFHQILVTDQQVLADLEDYLSKRGRTVNELSRAQADVPDGCRVIRNKRGTAPGMWFEKNGVHFFSLPGVPSEMKPMVTEVILPEMTSRYKLPTLVHRTVLTIGIGESDLAKMIADWEDSIEEAGLKLAYLPQPGQVRLRVSGRADDQQALTSLIDEKIDELQKLIGRFIYGYEKYGEETPGIVRILCDLLKTHKKTVALAESCTGGQFASQITALAGASEVFRGAIIPYTNAAKNHLLGVPREVFEQKGAVSEECVRILAQHVREKFASDYSAAISGIAGPTGGTAEKPVGTVWIAVSNAEKVVAKKFRFTDNRQQNITMSTNAAADMLRKLLLGEI